jgi:hypothetical protein
MTPEEKNKKQQVNQTWGGGTTRGGHEGDAGGLVGKRSKNVGDTFDHDGHQRRGGVREKNNKNRTSKVYCMREKVTKREISSDARREA